MPDSQHGQPEPKRRSNILRMLSLFVLPAIAVLIALAYDVPYIPRFKQAPLQRNAVTTERELSYNVSSCPGYRLQSLTETNTGLTAHLQLAGPACNAYGSDVKALTIEVTYETQSRLHVNIYDTEKNHYTIPDSVVSLPPPPTESFKHHSDLVFNYEPSPFAFWITRRSRPSATPLFDTRISSLPSVTGVPVISNDNSTTLDGFPLVFEDRYLQLSSALPLDTNVYGLGEVVASSGFRRDIRGSIQTMWNRDAADPVDENVYGSHPVYLEHRYDQDIGKSEAHGVFLFSAAGGDILLATPPNSGVSLIEYRMIGGVLDFYFFSGLSPKSVIEQYGELIGLPTWQPAWGFGFHLCRWGYDHVNETMEQVARMREANIPLEVMWNDIDLYHAYRDFTTDPVSFPLDEVREFIAELEPSEITTLTRADLRNGSEYIGQVWPGYTVFPDWFESNAQSWWTEALKNWSDSGVKYSGIWLDMNEAASFCEGSCGSGSDLSDTSLPFALPGEPENLITKFPECYDAITFGMSGNLTVNDASTCQLEVFDLTARGLGGDQRGADNSFPPYAIRNGFGPLNAKTIATNATHSGGVTELDVHNLWGLMEEKTTHLALQTIHPGKRPFLISRSTFPSAGKWSGHWLGDNHSLWSYMKHSIQGVLQFQIFQIPFVGPDACGFGGNAGEELCNRWMQLSAFMPFYRNHNVRGAISQEPYQWDSVAKASRTAMEIRYSLLPYWYTLFANSSRFGTPPVRALFFEFPDEPELFAIDTQYLIGADILVTPVLAPNVTTVEVLFPGRGKVIWRDWYTHDIVQTSTGSYGTLSASLGHINVHVRDGAAILMHAKPAYTVFETRQGPFALLVSQDNQNRAFGTAYLDDGESYPPGPNRELAITSSAGEVRIESRGEFEVEQPLQEVTVLGVSTRPRSLLVNGKRVKRWDYFARQNKLVARGLGVDLNRAALLSWK